MPTVVSTSYAITLRLALIPCLWKGRRSIFPSVKESDLIVFGKALMHLTKGEKNAPKICLVTRQQRVHFVLFYSVIWFHHACISLFLIYFTLQLVASFKLIHDWLLWMIEELKSCTTFFLEQTNHKRNKHSSQTYYLVKNSHLICHSHVRVTGIFKRTPVARRVIHMICLLYTSPSPRD